MSLIQKPLTTGTTTVKVARFLALASALAAFACSAPSGGTLPTQLAFQISGAETGITAARDLAVDHSGNVYVFDYADYVIRKFDPQGRLLTAFGGKGEEPGSFQHLMAIRVHGDSVLALDPGSLTVFDLSGNLRSRRILADTVTCDHPRLHPDGRWAAERIVEATAEKTLTYRRSDGSEQRQLASYALGEFFPGVEPGGLFFINPTQARSYLYGFRPDGRLVWAASDRLRILVEQDGVDERLYEAEATALPFPADQIAEMEERQSGLRPPLFMNVPTSFQLVQHLVVDESGEIWLYLTSRERTGLLRLSSAGRERGFYTVEADFDVLSARLAVAGERLYFMVPGREETAIYSVGLLTPRARP
jgi:hypothetical protein